MCKFFFFNLSICVKLTALQRISQRKQVSWKQFKSERHHTDSPAWWIAGRINWTLQDAQLHWLLLTLVYGMLAVSCSTKSMSVLTHLHFEQATQKSKELLDMRNLKTKLNVFYVTNPSIAGNCENGLAPQGKLGRITGSERRLGDLITEISWITLLLAVYTLLRFIS